MPDRIRLPREAALPEAVGQHRHTLWLAADRRVGFREDPARDRLKPEQRWRVAGVVLGPHRFGERGSGERLGETLPDVRAVQREGSLQRAELVGVHRGGARAARRGHQPHACDAVGARVGQRMQDHGIEHREQRRAGGDADGQNQHGGCGEATVAPQSARGVTKVLRQVEGHRVDASISCTSAAERNADV